MLRLITSMDSSFENLRNRCKIQHSTLIRNLKLEMVKEVLDEIKNVFRSKAESSAESRSFDIFMDMLMVNWIFNDFSGAE